MEETAAAAAARSLQSYLTLCDPIDSSPFGSPIHGFSRQEYWSGVPLPSPMEETKVIIKNQENEIFTLPRTVCYIMKYLDLIISVCLLEVKHEFFSPLLYCYSTDKSLLP